MLREAPLVQLTAMITLQRLQNTMHSIWRPESIKSRQMHGETYLPLPMALFSSRMQILPWYQYRKATATLYMEG